MVIRFHSRTLKPLPTITSLVFPGIVVVFTEDWALWSPGDMADALREMSEIKMFCLVDTLGVLRVSNLWVPTMVTQREAGQDPSLPTFGLFPYGDSAVGSWHVLGPRKPLPAVYSLSLVSYYSVLLNGQFARMNVNPCST